MSSTNQTNTLPMAGESEAASSIIQVGSVRDSEFKTGTLPADGIVNGNPIPRALSLTKVDDDLFSSGLWDCTEGTFYYTFPCDEIVHIIEGEVIVREEGKEYTLRPGDVAFFPQGMTCQWKIPNYLKKFAIYRSVSRSPLQKLLSRLKNLIAKKRAACLMGLKIAHSFEGSAFADLYVSCSASMAL